MDFGTIANVSLTSTVTVYGLYWLQRYKDTQYRFLAYKYWWMSWAAWVLAWLLIWLKQTVLDAATLKQHVLRFDLPILAFDNLNSVFLIVVYFAITRGRDYGEKQARALAIRLTVSLVIGYAALYGLFWRYPTFAYEIHRTCSLCIAVFTPVLVGWAFQLRFKTSIVLMIGSLYGFIQPIIYATELRSGQQGEFSELIENIRPVVTMIIALLKVTWAVASTKILCSARASDRNLIERDTLPAAQVLTGWWPSVALHAALLVAIYLGLLIMLVLRLGHDKLTPFGTAVGVITGVSGLWQIVWSVWQLRKF